MQKLFVTVMWLTPMFPDLHTAVYLQSDVLAGMAVGVMAVPQCVSFALMAGLPSAYGLYSAFLPVLAYALTGSSPQLV